MNPPQLFRLVEHSFHDCQRRTLTFDYAWRSHEEPKGDAWYADVAKASEEARYTSCTRELPRCR